MAKRRKFDRRNSDGRSQSREGGNRGQSDSLEQVYGIHAVQSLLDNAPQRVLEVMVLETSAKRAGSSSGDGRLQGLKQQAKSAGIAVYSQDKNGFDQLLGDVRHQGILAKVRPLPVRSDIDLDGWLDKAPAPLFLLILDGVQDPHNLGACLRSAEAAGVQAVIVPKDRAVGLTATARKVAVGAAERLPFFQVTNLARTMDELADRGVWLVGAAGEAQATLYEADLCGPLGIVMGSEEKGMRRLTRERCQALIHIPMQAPVESLNVSVATGICLFEAVRQRSQFVKSP